MLSSVTDRCYLLCRNIWWLETVTIGTHLQGYTSTINGMTTW